MNINHKSLGSDDGLKKKINKFKKISKQINITKYHNKEKKLEIKGSTVPHAGYEFSGLLAIFIINEILEYNSKEITILWFQHNKLSKQEHSLESVRKLVKLLNPNIKIYDILIDKDTNFDNVNRKIKGGLLVSTDFSHHNNGNPDTMKNVWLNDKKYFKKKNIITQVYPCGNQPLRIFKEWLAFNNLTIKLLCYSNSIFKNNWWHSLKKKTFDGVSYASLVSIDKSRDWVLKLESKLLAYSHLKWVKQFLTKKSIIIDNGLYWSPLKKIKGSCFVTVSDENDKTLSCFGDWESENKKSNLLDCIKNASLSVKTKSWNGNQPISKDLLKNKKYYISITLIEPIKNWKVVKKTKPKNRGYVYLKDRNVGMTFLPSVWELFDNNKDFFENLEKKHTNVYPDATGWVLNQYNSVSWKFFISVK